MYEGKSTLGNHNYHTYIGLLGYFSRHKNFACHMITKISGNYDGDYEVILKFTRKINP